MELQTSRAVMRVGISYTLNDDQRSRYGPHFSRCQSEIERLFIGAYLVTLERTSRDSTRIVVCESLESAEWMQRAMFEDEPEFERMDIIVLQQPIGPYVADFVVWRAFQDRFDAEPLWSPRVVVECDGHNYHERTKEQAEHDRRRDRELQRIGYRVLRFTGRELVRNAIACAMEVDHQLAEGCYAAAVDRHGLEGGWK